MCYIQVKESGRQADFKSLDKAQKHNKDGYGCAWYEDGFVKTYKTFDYNAFKGVIAALKHYSVVIHLRHLTKGSKDYNNIHPFDIPSGVMFHNGTMGGLGNATISDSQELANIISECEYKVIDDIMPFIKHKVNDKINRLVFFEDTGEITIVNKHLGIQDDGIWHSNDYHLKEDSWCRNGSCSSSYLPSKKHKVFVYGTLKRGYHNHRLLEKALYLGKARTTAKWAMIGKSLPFPYLLERNDNGYYVEGEVYEVSDSELWALDRLEGVPTHYRKENVYVKYLDDNVYEQATVYVKTSFSKDYEDKTDLIKCWGA